MEKLHLVYDGSENGVASFTSITYLNDRAEFFEFQDPNGIMAALDLESNVVVVVEDKIIKSASYVYEVCSVQRDKEGILNAWLEETFDNLDDAIEKSYYHDGVVYHNMEVVYDPEDLPKKINIEDIKHLILKSGISAYRLEQLLRISRTTISNYRNGDAEIENMSLKNGQVIQNYIDAVDWDRWNTEE